MQYALYGIYLDFEVYNGNFAFKWNDFNVEEFFYKNLKKFVTNYKDTNLYYWKNIKEQINRKTIDDDYTHLYSYRAIHKRDFEDLLFNDENEKFYYNNLKLIFLKENFYDIYINDNYLDILNYNNFIDNLKCLKLVNNKLRKKKNFDFKFGIELLELNNNIDNIRTNILNNNFFNK
jgi:hypothetical protein